MTNNKIAVITACVACFFLFPFNSFGRQGAKNNLIVSVSFDQLKELPLKIVIERSDLGDYNTSTDTSRVSGNVFKYERRILEPQFLRVVFYWPGRKFSNVSFWVVPSTYQLTIDNDLKPMLTNPSEFANKAEQIAQTAFAFRSSADKLVANVSYENKTIEEVEHRMDMIRDSVDKAIEELYKTIVLSNLNSPIGLYALCKYAERPYGSERWKTEPDKVQVLLNRLNAGIKNLPSAKALASKIVLGKQLSIGKMMKDVALPDTAGKIFKLSEFRGKYLLVDFWASWCTPCREENPKLISLFETYRNKGFQVLGVSRDRRSAKQLWLTAVRQDHIGIWPQLSDFDDIAQQKYGIRFLPSNFLVDPNGVIVGRNLRGEELEKILAKIFKN